MVILAAEAAPSGPADRLRAAVPALDGATRDRHIVNLSDGRFSIEGTERTSPADVDRIFDEHLPAFVAARGGTGVPLVFHAHGGLVDEAAGLAIAQVHIPWWTANGAYPVHFIWETGFWDALRSLFGGAPRALPGEAVARGFAEEVRNKIVETLARPLGPKVWGQMKLSAAQASASDGGAHYVASRLAAFTRENPEAVVLHAVGHSAGAIFHSHFLPAYRAAGGTQEFATLNLLAPSLNVPEFKQRLLPLVRDGIRSTTMFTLRRELELADSIGDFYGHSLLYLVSRSLETERNTPLLGLQESVEADPELRELFTRPGSGAGAVWSIAAGAEDSRSSATTHAGFDADADTMTSVAARVLGRSGVVRFPGTAAPSAPAPAGAGRPAPAPVRTGGGARTGVSYALCVGVNEFANLPPASWLYGCVNDAEDFRALLEGSYGFDGAVDLLRDAEATREAVLGRLEEAVGRAEAGELRHLVFTFSSHGTQVPDPDGDEPDRADEAFATYDLGQRGEDWDRRTLIVDDELHALFARVPRGVLLDVVLDTCHSGTGLRALDLLRGRRPRFLPPPTPVGLETVEGAGQRTLRDLVRSAPGAGRPVLLAACTANQTAADATFGDSSNGAFTYYLLRELRAGGDRSRAEIHKAVGAALKGGSFAQRPQLEGSAGARRVPWGTGF